MVEAFNQAHAARGWRVELSFFPDFQLSERTAIGAAARDLPDVLEIDGPLAARCVEAGLLAPLDRLFSAEDLADLIPTIIDQGTINGRLYTLGSFDSSMVLYYDREMLARAGVDVPESETISWTWDEFIRACRTLKAAGIEPLAMHLNETADEWYTYAFTPIVWSVGGRLISEHTPSVRGILSSPDNVQALRSWQSLFVEGLAATDPIDPDPFGRGQVALDWSGHWLARSHEEAKGDRLGVMPLPVPGSIATAPCGSFCWAISATAKHPEIAAAWLRWVTGRDTGIIPFVRANGAVPARRSAFAAFPEYQRSPYRLFRWQVENIARPRPKTPYYATLTQSFAAALRDIARGAGVESRLRTAEDEIQRVIDRRATGVRPTSP